MKKAIDLDRMESHLPTKKVAGPDQQMGRVSLVIGRCAADFSEALFALKAW
jgi:hypothetical protein